DRPAPPPRSLRELFRSLLVVQRQPVSQEDPPVAAGYGDRGPTPGHTREKVGGSIPGPGRLRHPPCGRTGRGCASGRRDWAPAGRSEEHTAELQSRETRV